MAMDLLCDPAPRQKQGPATFYVSALCVMSSGSYRLCASQMWDILVQGARRG